MINNRNFPTSTHYFPDLINDNAIYVDKTAFIEPLLANQNNANYFLSRPRRFGKSLFVSTLEQVFLGNRNLFKGLYIEDKIEWETYPVIRLSLDKIGFTDIGLEKALFEVIEKVADKQDIILKSTSYSTRFSELIEKLYLKTQKRVVILIDEYDKPIIHYIDKTQPNQAEINRDILKSFYGVLKDSGQYLRFTFITGVSKFSKVSIFSDLNYFEDLTLDPAFATICGFTETEVRHYCHAGLEDLAVKANTNVEAIMDKVRYWYDGFSWNAKDFLYNPYSTMLLMKKQVFDNYWFESGTPTFLVKLINADFKYSFNNIEIESSIYEWHDLRKLNYLSIMLQTGYLTFKKHIVDNIYRLGYPNKEVENAFSKMLLGGYMDEHPAMTTMSVFDIEKALKKNDLEAVILILKNMFKSLPAPFFKDTTETIDKQGNKKMVQKPITEAFYHAIIYLVFKILGIHIQVELITQEGRLDAVVETENHIYIFEFKKNRIAQVAMNQILEKKYADHFALSNPKGLLRRKQIYLIGVAFNLRHKGISDHKIERWIPPAS